MFLLPHFLLGLLALMFAGAILLVRSVVPSTSLWRHALLAVALFPLGLVVVFVIAVMLAKPTLW